MRRVCRRGMPRASSRRSLGCCGGHALLAGCRACRMRCTRTLSWHEALMTPGAAAACSARTAGAALGKGLMCSARRQDLCQDLCLGVCVSSGLVHMCALSFISASACFLDGRHCLLAAPVLACYTPHTGSRHAHVTSPAPQHMRPASDRTKAPATASDRVLVVLHNNRTLHAPAMPLSPANPAHACQGAPTTWLQARSRQKRQQRSQWCCCCTVQMCVTKCQQNRIRSSQLATRPLHRQRP